MTTAYTPEAIAALVAAAEGAKPSVVGPAHGALCEALEPFTSADPPMFSEFALARWGPHWTIGKAKAQAISATYVSKREYARAEQDYRNVYGREPW